MKGCLTNTKNTGEFAMSSLETESKKKVQINFISELRFWI